MVDRTNTLLFDDEDLAEEKAGSGMPMTAAEVTATAEEEDPELNDEDDVEDTEDAEEDDEVEA